MVEGAAPKRGCSPAHGLDREEHPPPRWPSRPFACALSHAGVRGSLMHSRDPASVPVARGDAAPSDGRALRPCNFQHFPRGSASSSCPGPYQRLQQDGAADAVFRAAVQQDRAAIAWTAARAHLPPAFARLAKVAGMASRARHSVCLPRRRHGSSHQLKRGLEEVHKQP